MPLKLPWGASEIRRLSSRIHYVKVLVFHRSLPFMDHPHQFVDTVNDDYEVSL